MNMTDVGSTVTISRARYAELVIAERDANRLKEIIASRAKEYGDIKYSELRILSDLLVPEAKEEEK